MGRGAYVKGILLQFRVFSFLYGQLIFLIKLKKLHIYSVLDERHKTITINNNNNNISKG